jgi:hypothetical protein
MNLKIRIIFVISVIFLIGSCQKEELSDDIRLSKVYSDGSLFLEYFYNQDGLNHLVHSYAYYDGGNNISTINEYEYDGEGRPIHRTFTNLIHDNDSENYYYYNEATGFIDSVAIFENGTRNRVHIYHFSDRKVETRRFYVYEDQPSREYDRIIRLLDENDEISERVWYQFDKEEGSLRWSDSSHYEYDNFNAPFVGNLLKGVPYSKHNILNITSYKTTYSTGTIDTVYQEFEYSYNEDLYPTKRVHITMGGYDEYEYINLNE